MKLNAVFFITKVKNSTFYSLVAGNELGLTVELVQFFYQSWHGPEILSQIPFLSNHLS
ncbi:hypothetical protein A33Q_3386 [Indibacter alkaliphilus LW1]|uniref:Uncharacterized protein n=1 Tax=Indibacter alkaliphilus (strain CCUG 57479 / KCTC 22604 / LW1) TaxID=1189612 RepID=S2DSZ3_INDAL|nr:hypothetical protein A33Q_3386 [Indibacter alkaliphilus LW1]